MNILIGCKTGEQAQYDSHLYSMRQNLFAFLWTRIICIIISFLQLTIVKQLKDNRRQK